jgi:RNA polymerase sigma-70 factor (sigma-E family)
VRDDEFAAFVDAQLPRLLGYARVLAGNDHDAWDLVQEALVRVGLRWSRIERHGNPVGYTRTTLVRLNVDRHRRVGRERLMSAVPDSPSYDDRPGIEPWLVAALSTLPVRQRTALVLRYVDDLDHAGIAEAMGCSVGTARSHVSRGLAALRSVAPEGSALATTTGVGDV